MRVDELVIKSDPIKTLLIEDNPDDAMLMGAELVESKRASFEVAWVTHLSEALARLDTEEFDVVLLDLSLPDSSGPDTCHKVHVAAPRVPIVVLTGLNDEEVAVGLLKESAQDYLIKGQVEGRLLVRSMIYAIERNRLLTQLKAAKESAEARLRVVAQNTPVILFALDNQGVFTPSEGKGLESVGSKPGELVGKSVFAVYHDISDILENVRAALAGEPRGCVVHVADVTLDTWYQPLIDKNGHVTGVVGVAHDITERRRLEAQLVQSQKMEAVGLLAGGIAHDFNNLLTAMLGYSSLGLAKAAPDEPLSAYLTEVTKAAERAAHLTRQLLAFARSEVAEPKILDLNDLVFDLDLMLRSLIGENVELVVLPGADLGLVRADPGQMEQVLVNLAVNASDAMPDGGKLVIETANVVLDEGAASQRGNVAPGEFVVVAVSDTGTGMTDRVKAHAFEPFFTTKEVGEGTGLGLSTCYGIASQNGGHILVESELDHGTTLKMYFPRVAAGHRAPPPPEGIETLPMGDETVLLVDDEPSVRGAASAVLSEQGYNVVEAANGQEAMCFAQECPEGELDLLLTDVVMPVMGGRELAGHLRAVHPAAKVLFMSGYADDGLSQDSADFMQKPFGVAALALKAREVLDRP